MAGIKQAERFSRARTLTPVGPPSPPAISQGQGLRQDLLSQGYLEEKQSDGSYILRSPELEYNTAWYKKGGAIKDKYSQEMYKFDPQGRLVEKALFQPYVVEASSTGGWVDYDIKKKQVEVYDYEKGIVETTIDNSRNQTFLATSQLAANEAKRNNMSQSQRLLREVDESVVSQGVVKIAGVSYPVRTLKEPTYTATRDYFRENKKEAVYFTSEKSIVDDSEVFGFQRFETSDGRVGAASGDVQVFPGNKAERNKFLLNPAAYNFQKQKEADARLLKEWNEQGFNTPREVLYGKTIDSEETNYYGWTDKAQQRTKELWGETAKSEVALGKITGVAGTAFGVGTVLASTIVEPAVYTLFPPRADVNAQAGIYDDDESYDKFLARQKKVEAQFTEGKFQLGMLYAGAFETPRGYAATRRVKLSVKEQRKVGVEFDEFLNQQGMKGGVITGDDALKIQKFFLKYNRAGQKTDVMKFLNEKRLVKGSRVLPGGKNEVGVELSLRNIESITILEKTRNRGPTVFQDTFLIAKKGKAELVNPKDINQFDFVRLQGVSKKFTAPNKPILRNNLLMLDNKVKAFKNVDGSMGSLSNLKKEGFFVEQSVNQLSPAKQFDELLSLKGATIDRGDFQARIDSLDLPNAKIFKRQAVDKVKNGGFEDFFRVENLQVSGFSPKSAGYQKQFNGLKIGRKYKQKGSRVGIEDQRFRLTYKQKKELTAKNIKEITEFEGGTAIKVYSFDDSGYPRFFREFEVYIPRKSPSVFMGNVGKKPVITLSQIIEKNKKTTPTNTFKETETKGGDGLVQLQQVKTENKMSSILKTMTLSKTKSKSKSRSESKKKQAKKFKTFTVSGDGGDKVYMNQAMFSGEAKVYSPTKQDLGSVSSVNVKTRPFVATMSRSDVAVAFMFASGQKNPVKTSTKSRVNTMIASKVATKIFSGTRSRVKQKASSDYANVSDSVFKNPFRTRQGRGRFDDVNPPKRPPVFKLPKFDGSGNDEGLKNSMFGGTRVFRTNDDMFGFGKKGKKLGGLI